MHLKKIIFFLLLVNIAIRQTETTTNAQACSLKVNILSEEELKDFYIIENVVDHTGTDACINKVTNGTDIYILKQIAHASLNEQLLLVTDAICSTIGTIFNINVNQVYFIPYNVGEHLKIHQERAATLHRFIDGKDLERELPKHLPEEFTIHQRIIKKNSPWQKKYPLSPNLQGVTKNIIESMSNHEDLPKIVALDTFIGNADRSLPNIFYNEKNNRFYGIDHAAGFHSILGVESYKRIKELMESNYFSYCPVSIKNSLHSYKKNLKKLIDNCNPEIVENMIKPLITHLCPDGLCNTEIKEDISYFKKTFELNFLSIIDLIALLDTIV